jgi:hypothetical protein
VTRRPPPLGEISDQQPDEQGDLTVTAPIRALYRLLVAKSTGLLVATIGGIRKEIYVAEGVPLYVSSNIGKELFGEYLVSGGCCRRASWPWPWP